MEPGNATNPTRDAKTVMREAMALLRKIESITLNPDAPMPDIRLDGTVAEASGLLAAAALDLHNRMLKTPDSSPAALDAASRRRKDDFIQDMSFDKLAETIANTYFVTGTVALLEGVSTTGALMTSEELGRFLLGSLRGHDLLASYPDNRVVLLLKDTGLPLAGILIKRIQAAVERTPNLARIDGIFMPFTAGPDRLSAFTKAIGMIKPLMSDVKAQGGGMHPAIGTF